MRIDRHDPNLCESHNRYESREGETKQVNPIRGGLEIVCSIFTDHQLLNLLDFSSHKIEEQKNNGDSPKDVKPGQADIILP